tara:strand:+ start:1812 stop:2111 length:300 start_codon:yes stop_codon:yes gene_type:complete
MTYSGGIEGNFVPHGGSGTGSAIPGIDISSEGPGLYPETTTVPTGDITITTTGTYEHDEIKSKLDEINAKLDHVLEHLHQPITGTVHLECPPKVPSGQT